MKRVFNVVSTFILIIASCVASADQYQRLPIKIFDMPTQEHSGMSRNVESLAKEIDQLNYKIGGYPPVFTSEMDREGVYLLWSNLLADALVYQKESQSSEMSLSLLAQLYRQGHNMDVRGAAESANLTIMNCLDIYPKSVPCHFESSYFYLQVSPMNTKMASRSLKYLRKHFKKKLNEEVESGFVFLYLQTGKYRKATKQINYFFKQFPDSNRVEMFKQIKKGIEEKKVKTVHTEFGG